MWFVLNYVPVSAARRKSLPALIEAFNTTLPSPLTLFAPTFVALSSGHDKVRKVEKPLLYHYIFLKGDEVAIKRLCITYEGFSFVMDRTGRSRHLTIDEATMQQFMIVARYFGNRLPCFPLEGINLEEGDTVQIVSGPCAGLTGTFMSRKGGKSGNILIAVDHSLAVVVYDVKADYVRVLEFARDSRRVYDQLDAYTLRLLTVVQTLRKDAVVRDFRDCTVASDEAFIAATTVFVRRLGLVKLNNPKLEAKLQLLLFAAYTILGDSARRTAALEKYRSLADHVTNVWTRLLAHLLLGIFLPDPAEIEAAKELIPSLPDKRHSSLQSLLLTLLTTDN